ncbi:ABC transporter permease [Polaromonas sp. A23]|uniref:ABC transporter permease n=1 Tax=Polaromonas sp. A23 TaxID=1944133 RepID=UPI0009855564|nr:ABC transporter permease [Polaromonas sp. A23]OOG44619.1 peptide ABC transporter permease [Polaromonas sp. A23]
MQLWQLLRQRLWRNSAFRFGVLVLGVLLLLAALAPFLGTVDPAAMDSAHINTAAGVRGEFAQLDGTVVTHTFWMGADNFGRDIFSRVLYGTRTSLLVATFTAAVAIGVGALLGMLAGYFRIVDAVLMRFMDGLMAIPAILLAIALVAALGAQLWTVVVAIAIPEIPRVTRLVRAMVLTLREEPFVEAARALATPTPVILWRHILPNAMAPLIVQGTFVAASAVLTEAILSFLGLGLPADIPTWGNIMAEGRVQFTQYPGNVLFPALFLVPTVLAINLLGDGLRDVLDPKFSKRTP